MATTVNRLVSGFKALLLTDAPMIMLLHQAQIDSLTSERQRLSAAKDRQYEEDRSACRDIKAQGDAVSDIHSRVVRSVRVHYLDELYRFCVYSGRFVIF